MASPTWSSTEQVARPAIYETIPPVRLETSGGVLSTVDMVVQRRDGPRRLRDDDDDDDVDNYVFQCGRSVRELHFSFVQSVCCEQALAGTCLQLISWSSE